MSNIIYTHKDPLVTIQEQEMQLKKLTEDRSRLLRKVDELEREIRIQRAEASAARAAEVQLTQGLTDRANLLTTVSSALLRIYDAKSIREARKIVDELHERIRPQRYLDAEAAAIREGVLYTLWSLPGLSEDARAVLAAFFNDPDGLVNRDVAEKIRKERMTVGRER